MKIKPLNLLLISFLVTSFTLAKGQKSSNNLNLSLLLDLSDRIDPKKYPSLYQRDLQYIKSVQKAFTNHIKGKKIIQLNDQMQVFFDPEPQNPTINSLSQQLKVNFNKKSGKNEINSLDKTYSDIPAKIYQSAIKDKTYLGSDIWRFFKNNVKDYCIKDDYRNILVIITDGYMYHQNSKFTEKNKSSYITPAFIQAKKLTTSTYRQLIEKGGLGFITATENLQNLEIIVLGINPSKNNPYESDVINQYWADWLKSMGVKKYHLKNNDLPTNLEPVILKIISRK
ncbi:hypothetical protein [Pedobacter ureilyticus]|uniref:VWFA domain-containing protein n=1 Tax=Pedobacter ureilyticus TaxID=1393051 RepID=A0ABW9J1N9_9SPHI|nr:hypothetical protein [Pedobacter helvus]